MEYYHCRFNSFLITINIFRVLRVELVSIPIKAASKTHELFGISLSKLDTPQLHLKAGQRLFYLALVGMAKGELL